MMWRPTKKSSGKAQDTLLTDAEKLAWETHPITKGKYSFREEKEPEKQRITPPFEARDFVAKVAADPKKPNQAAQFEPIKPEVHVDESGHVPSQSGNPERLKERA